MKGDVKEEIKYYLECARKVFLVMTAIIAGIFIFVSSSALQINRNILSPSFHEKLFVKHDIYSGVTFILDNSITKFIAYIKEVSPDTYTQQKDIFDTLEQTTSKEAVTRSIDYLREGIYEYLSDQRKFLPDIVLKPSNDNSSSTDTQKNSSNLYNISKVNLGAVLTYANRNDIVDYLAFAKLFYNFSNRLPNLILPLLLLFFIISFCLFKNFKELFNWLKGVFLTCGTLFLVAVLSMFISTYFWLPRKILSIYIVISMDSRPVLDYIKDCVNPFLLFGIIICALCGILIFVINKYCKRYDKIPVAQIDSSSTQTQIKVYRIVKLSIFSFIVILLTSTFVFRVNAMVKDYKENDYASVIYKMKGVQTMSEVIPAKDDLIHDAEIKVVDGKTQEPVTDIRLNVTGKNGDNGKEYSDSKVLDKSGYAKFNLDKGTYKLSFYTPTFPSDKYKLPGSVFFDLNTPGTKVITINLEPVQTVSTKTGFAEVEILDNDNKPVTGVELQVSSEVAASGHPDTVSAVSNSQGIAVFKLNEGSYTVNFNSTKLPVKYNLPQEFTISVNADKTSRYTIKMTNK